jgi:stearoyl-CoA desaturase (Delta-9 desaturase)
MKNTIKSKFLQQQILIVIGLLGVGISIIFSILTNSWLLLFLSFLYSQIVVSFFSEQIVLHRYFCHRSFEVNKFLYWIFYIASILPGQGSPVGWTASHRHHHKHSDQELDNHSPREGYLLAAGGWLLKGYNWIVIQKKLKTIPTDLLRIKSLSWLDRNYYNIWILLLFISFIDFKFFLFFVIAPIGWTLILSAMVSLGCHIKIPFSYRNFETSDDTYNNKLIQLVILGDALHNNHHRFPNEYNLAIKNNEFDLAGKLISLLKVK